MKRYIFLCEDYPLGQFQFDEEKGVGEFTYVYSSSAPQVISVNPSSVITLLEDVRAEAMNIKTIGQFNSYVNSKFGKLRFEPMKGYE